MRASTKTGVLLALCTAVDGLAIMPAAADTVLVSNFGEPIRDATPIGNPAFWGAQSFLPDNNTYQLGSIEALLGNGLGAPQVVAELRRADAMGRIDQTPAGLLTTFAAPDVSGAAAPRLFAPDVPVTLQPGTPYWFVLGSANAGTYDWSYADTNDWTGPGALNIFADSSDAGATWLYHDFEFPFFLRVNVNDGGGGSEWNLDASGDWNVAGNWTGGVPNGAGAVANFLGAITAPRTVYTDTPVTLGTLRLDNAHAYHLTGTGSLTIDVAAGNGSIVVAGGSHKINLPLHLGGSTDVSVASGATLNIADPLVLNGNTLTKTGDGVMLIEAPVRSTAAAAINVAGGEARVNFEIGTPATATTAANAPVALRVSGAKLTLGADQTLRGLDSETAGAGDQEIDLAGNTIRAYPADRDAEELNIYNDIRAARDSASGRDGIYDRMAPASGYSVGVTDQSIDAHGDASVIVRLTRNGDATVDGVVSLADFNRLAAAFGQVGRRWDDGDFNYDGSINLTDFNMLAANFGLSASGPEVTPQDWSNLAAAVPEPIGGAALLLAAALLGRRPRQRIQ